MMFRIRLPEEDKMVRERAIQVILAVVGLLFVALIIPLIMFFSRDPAVAMIMSLYVPLGVFLLLAVRNPTANRDLIAYAGWANVAHAGVMAVQAYLHVIERQELAGVALFGIVGILLISLTPAKQGAKQASAIGA
jgi:succinate-acetate transporter protein